MLSTKNKAKLKKIAHSSQLVKINIGKGLLDKEVINNINNCFNTHELVKINFLKSSLEDANKEALILDLISSLRCELIQKIGNTLILYKENTKIKDHIVL